MAIAKKCDICGQFYSYYETTSRIKPRMINAIALATINRMGLYEVKECLDCCVECLTAIEHVIEERKADDAQHEG